MLLNTRYFGQIEIDPKNIIDFPEGIPGFENVKKFVLLHHEDQDSPFQWLQGVDNPHLAFVVVDPRLCKQDYVVDIEDAEVAILDIRDTGKVLIYSIVVVPEDLSKMTANLKAPVLINTENNKGKQVILNNEDYPIKYYILQQLQKTGG
jgi:flagellar assembly factor FliW